MKKVLALLFIGSTLTFAACQTKPKTEEAAVDSTATTTMSTDTTTMAADSAMSTTVVTDSATTTTESMTK
jgi:hypothetical protein